MRVNQPHRSASSSRQRFDRPPPHPQTKTLTVGPLAASVRTESSVTPGALKSQSCKPRNRVTLSALSNEGIENNRSHTVHSCGAQLRVFAASRAKRPSVLAPGQAVPRRATFFRAVATDPVHSTGSDTPKQSKGRTGMGRLALASSQD